MVYKFLTALVFLCIVCPGESRANSTALVRLDLTLAGYQLGMSYDDVAKVRPFRYEQSSIKNSENTSTFYAFVDRAYVDGAAMSLQVSFKNDKAHKIVAKVSPGLFENVKSNIQQAIGTGEDKSRVFRNYNDEEIHQTIYRWDFPNAEIHLIEVSTNPEYLTISLTDK